MAKYASERIILTWADNQDVITLTPSAGRRIVLDEFSYNLYYSGTPSAGVIANTGLVIAHSQLDGGGANNPAIAPLDPDSPASTTVANSNWTTSPTIVGEIVSLPANLNYGITWHAQEDGLMAITQNSGGRLSFRMRAGNTPPPEFNLFAECVVIWEEY